MFPVADGLPTFVANDWGEIYRKLASGPGVGRGFALPLAFRPASRGEE
jgi:hypothetical protein